MTCKVRVCNWHVKEWMLPQNILTAGNGIFLLFVSIGNWSNGTRFRVRITMVFATMDPSSPASMVESRAQLHLGNGGKRDHGKFTVGLVNGWMRDVWSIWIWHCVHALWVHAHQTQSSRSINTRTSGFCVCGEKVPNKLLHFNNSSCFWIDSLVNFDVTCTAVGWGTIAFFSIDTIEQDTTMFGGWGGWSVVVCVFVRVTIDYSTKLFTTGIVWLEIHFPDPFPSHFNVTKRRLRVHFEFVTTYFWVQEFIRIHANICIPFTVSWCSWTRTSMFLLLIDPKSIQFMDKLISVLNCSTLMLCYRMGPLSVLKCPWMLRSPRPNWWAELSLNLLSFILVHFFL